MRCAFVSVVSLVLGCVEPPPLAPSGQGELPVGERREVVMTYLRFDVKSVEKVITKDDILHLPKTTRENLWLLDLDLTAEGNPKLFDNSLTAIKALDVDDETLPQPVRNMVKLLTMSPSTADLTRTSMEPLVSLSPKIGIAPGKLLADCMGIATSDPFLTNDRVQTSLLDNVVSTHPNARYRRGKMDAEHPDGRYPVAPGHLPVTLEDAASDMASLAERFGEYWQDGVYHPGFVVGPIHSQLLLPTFQMKVKASANALPLKGLDATDVSIANVTSIASEADRLFDFNDPEWLVIDGMNPSTVKVDEVTIQVVDDPRFFAAAGSPLPFPQGGNPGWESPRWTLEHVVLDAAFHMFDGLAYHEDVYVGPSPAPLAVVDVLDGWLQITTLGNIATPPPGMYVWDLIGEVAQVRMHDGGLKEGDASVRFTLTDVPVGLTVDQIKDAVKRNLEEDPSGLVATANELFDQTSGAADFFYLQPRKDAPPDLQGDYLFFVAPGDIPKAPDGQPRRPYSYAHPGFFADEGLTDKRSGVFPLDADTDHEKLRVSEGDVLYFEDDAGSLFRLDVGQKPSKGKLKLGIERLR